MFLLLLLSVTSNVVQSNWTKTLQNHYCKIEVPCIAHFFLIERSIQDHWNCNRPGCNSIILVLFLLLLLNRWHLFPAILWCIRAKYYKEKQLTLHKKWILSLRISSVNVTKSAVTFTEKILDGKLHFLSSESRENEVTKKGASISDGQVLHELQLKTRSRREGSLKTS